MELRAVIDSLVETFEKRMAKRKQHSPGE